MLGTLPDFVYCILICIMFEKYLQMTLRERTLKDSIEQICTYVNAMLGKGVWECTSVYIRQRASYVIIFMARMRTNFSKFYSSTFPTDPYLNVINVELSHGILIHVSKAAVSQVIKFITLVSKSWMVGEAWWSICMSLGSECGKLVGSSLPSFLRAPRVWQRFVSVYQEPPKRGCGAVWEVHKAKSQKPGFLCWLGFFPLISCVIWGQSFNPSALPSPYAQNEVIVLGNL